MLKGRKARYGYDWWWHSLLAKNDSNGELEPFFIEYFVINPALSPDKPVYGQLSSNREQGIMPSYAMVKAGKWGLGKSQIHNFFASRDFSASTKGMDVKIGANTASEHHLKGALIMGKVESDMHPEYMSDPGNMLWDIQVVSKIPYSVGYGASALFRRLNLFEMFWHVGGMITRYSGTITYNGQTYTVEPDTCAGYQDKNWGRDYTNPWIWLNCNRFKNEKGELLQNTGLDIGGGNPKVLGKSLGNKILVAFHHEGKLYEFNFSRFFFQKQEWNCRIDTQKIYWDVVVENKSHVLEVHFSSPRDTMMLVNYENPAGEKRHHSLWNGGYASGDLKLYKKHNKEKVLQLALTGEMGGCEYGAES
jgi:hypothetical protein